MLSDDQTYRTRSKLEGFFHINSVNPGETAYLLRLVLLESMASRSGT